MPYEVIGYAPIDLPGTLGWPDYLIAWEPPSSAFLAGETPPLKFAITRGDGLAVDIPTIAAITVRDAGGTTVATLVATPDSAVAAVSLVMAALWPATPAGIYTATLTLTMPDGEIVAVETVIQVQAV